MMDIIMNDDEKARNIYTRMNYSINLNNTNENSNNFTISEEDKENFDKVKQILFDKIATCFMFEKLYSFYDNFRLVNLKRIMHNSNVNDTIKLFDDNELELFIILFSGGKKSYFECFASVRHV